MGWFQHTAARRRLPHNDTWRAICGGVSTHSRTKAAAAGHYRSVGACPVSTHSRTKAAAHYG